MKIIDRAKYPLVYRDEQEYYEQFGEYVRQFVEKNGLNLEIMDVQGEFVTPTGAAIAAAVKTSDVLPKAFRMLVMCSPQVWEYAPPKGLEVLDMPVRAAELRARVSSLEEDFTQWRKQERRRKGKRRLPRDPQEEALILEAKALLEQRRSMGEAEAHRYLQKLAMDTGVSLPEAAAKVKVSFQSR